MITHFFGYKPVSFKKVQIEDLFWSPRIKANRTKTIPAIYRHNKETGRIDALKLKWRPGKEPKPHVFWDSDVAKWVESASYSLETNPDPQLMKLVDEVVDLIIASQQPDGYLNSYFTVAEPDKRWTDLRDSHELYCAGHLAEAAVAHYKAIGDQKFLNCICRYIDYINKIFGKGEDKKHGYPGHPEIELALIKLYRVTGEKRYLELSHYFISERGCKPNYFDEERIARGCTPSHFEWYFKEPGRHYSHEYNQSYKPVLKQDRVTGHAVRAMYLYSAMADLAVEFRDAALLKTCKRLWGHLTEKLLYLTGGIGSSDRNEGFTTDYDLPNKTAYCETCASIGLVFWSHRLLQADCDGRYADIMELALYNRVACGVSLDGTKFFYNNPLSSDGKHHRKDGFDVSCCPANASRLFASLGQYLYSGNRTEIVVHLYMKSTAELYVSGQNVILKQETNYPWDGHIEIIVNPEKTARFNIKFRIPGWCEKAAAMSINGKRVPVINKRGYVNLNRKWQAGDIIALDFDMPIERVYSHLEVKSNRGRVALRRGPIIYCLEEVDNCNDLDACFLPRETELKAVYESDLLGGIITIHGSMLVPDTREWGLQLYRRHIPAFKKLNIKAIPYCVWDNRDPGEMIIWLRET